MKNADKHLGPLLFALVFAALVAMMILEVRP